MKNTTFGLLTASVALAVIILTISDHFFSALAITLFILAPLCIAFEHRYRAYRRQRRLNMWISYQNQLKDECDLNAYESQSPE